MLVVATFSAGAANTSTKTPSHKKEYWVVTEGILPKDEQLYTITSEFQGNPLYTNLLNLVWYCDYNGMPQPISIFEKNGWRLQNNLKVWSEWNGANLIYYAQLYGNGNRYPETIIWTLTQMQYPSQYTIYMNFYAKFYIKSGTVEKQILIHPGSPPETIRLGMVDSIQLMMSMFWG